MKNTILKMAGTKDEKSFYKKYPTEAAFLKAHPKAKAELKKFATGGQMNAQAMQQFAGGGFFQDAGEGIGNYFKAVADTTLGTFGATNVIKDSDYSGYGANEMSNLNKTLQPMTNTAAKIIGGAVGGPLGAAAVGGAQQLIGSFNPEDNTGLDENGNPKNPDAAKYQQAGQTVAQLGNIGAQIYGASKSPNVNSGVQNNGLMKRAMGGMQQYAMGGFGNPNNPQASMGVNPNNPQISMSINKVNTNPYESSPAYKAAQAANFYSTGTLYSPGAAKGMTTSELVRQHNAASKMPGYEEFGNLKYLSGNINQGTSLFEKTVNGKKSNYYYGKNKEGAFGFFPEVKTQVNNTQVNRQVNPQINPVNNIQNTTQTNTQPLVDRQETNFGQKYQTFNYKGANGDTTKYIDPTTNNELDPNLAKSFDPKGNYVPSFLPQQPNANSIPISTNKYGGQMQYAMGGEIQYANGGTGEINAEVEDNENAIGPNGEFTQFNGPTHAEGGIETDMAPGTMIFSDKLKMPGSKKSFAALNKLYDTNKEDDVLSNEKSNNTLKLTAMLMRDAKLKQSLALFQAQEQLKQDKVAAYAKRMGVQIPSQDNEQMEPQGMPEQSEGEMAMGGFNSYQNGGFNDRMNYTTRNLDNNSYDSYRKINTETGPRFYNASSPDLSTANKMIDFKIRNNQSDSIPMNQIPQNVITNFKNYQVGGNTDSAKIPDLLRQQRANNAALAGIRSSFRPKDDTTNINDPLVVALNKSKNFGKELEDKIKNNPEFKKAMGGRFPMYQMAGWNVPSSYTGYIPQNDYMQIAGIPAIQTQKGIPYTQSENMVNTNLVNKSNNNFQKSEVEPGMEHPYLKNQYTLPYGKDLAINENETGAISLGNQTIQSKTLGTPTQTNNDSGSNFYNNQFYDENYVPPLDPVPPKGEGFDWANAGKQAGQFALQNAGNIYDLFRSTQDNSKLNLARYSPTLLDKTQDLANNQRMYSEGKRQTAEASQGNASTYLNNMYANRASKLANDLNVNTTYGNLNSQIENSAKLYNAGAIDKETMFKLQAEGANRNLRSQALSGMGQNFMSQAQGLDKNKMDQKTLDFYTKYYNDASFKNMVDKNFKK